MEDAFESVESALDDVVDFAEGLELDHFVAQQPIENHYQDDGGN